MAPMALMPPRVIDYINMAPMAPMPPRVIDYINMAPMAPMPPRDMSEPDGSKTHPPTG